MVITVDKLSGAPLYLQLTVVEETDTIYTAAVVDDLGWLRLVWKRADEGK